MKGYFLGRLLAIRSIGLAGWTKTPVPTLLRIVSLFLARNRARFQFSTLACRVLLRLAFAWWHVDANGNTGEKGELVKKAEVFEGDYSIKTFRLHSE